MEQVQQELIRSNEFLARQIQILGGTIIFISGVLGFFARQWAIDLKEKLIDHEERIRMVEDHKIKMSGLVEQHEKDITDHRSLMRQLSDNVNRLSKI
jgi:hypothetical protein